MKFLKRYTKTLFIILGNSCNMNCSYCIQHSSVNIQIKNIINPDIYDFICETAYENKEHKLRIVFYGGEPLLYFENIKEIVGELNRRHSVQFEYHIISNGKAVTDNIVKFFNENNFGVAISWDGCYTIDTRGYDVFAEKEQRNRILKIQNLCLTGVVSGKAYPKQILEFFQEISNEYYGIHGYHVKVNLDELIPAESMDKGLLDIDFDRVEKEMNEIVSVLDGYIDNTDYFNFNDSCKLYYLRSIMDKISQDEDRWRGHASYCGNGLSILNMDLQGNLYPCHNAAKNIGTIYDQLFDVIMNNLATDNTYKNHQACKNCEGFGTCRSGCKLVENKNGKSTYCMLKKAMVIPIINYVKKINNSIERSNGR